ncbi:hypothetical protein ACP70R_004096 [Stipagrostis hirtigluma subsp. patula]
MAEAVVGVLIGKLGTALAKEATAYGASLLCKEASALTNFFDEIRKAEVELQSMKAYLRDTEKFKDTNETTSIFVKEIRGLAFRIEDVVDEFTYKLEDNKHGGFTTKMKKRLKHVKVWHRLASELCDINAKLEDATKRRDRYAMPIMERHIGGSDHHARSAHQMPLFAREEDLVGIKDNADKLKKWLVGDLEKNKNKTITVWGMGGVGKTTLVDHVYKIVKEDFHVAGWVTVSKNYHVDDLLKKIAREFGISFDGTNMELRILIEAIRNHLKGKRYILVLDDVWEVDVWINNIMVVLPTNCISRFVLTSRNYEVASLATDSCAINLEPLGVNRSRKLFDKLAFQNTDGKRCPPELQDLAVKFLQKCDGLPIAIACIARLLSCKPPTYSIWENVYKELLQSTKNVISSVDVIIKVSLEDLPYELKNCFLHCAIFPEDHKMKRRRLIRHWITNGFIKEKDNKTLEQVAEGYLNELVNRSLLQVVAKNEFGRVKCCQMHDIVRRLALEKAETECFSKIYEGSGTFSVDSENIRRLSIQSTNIAHLSQSGAVHLRAVHFFTSNVNISLLRSILASSNLLSTLDLEGTEIEMLPNEVFNLFNLRFLGLRSTRIEILPEAIGRLENLEVLDAANTRILSLPKAVTKLKKLRYLYAFTEHHEANHWTFRGTKVPRGIRHLTGLHALQTVNASLEALCDIAALTELRTFAICDVTSDHSLNLCSAIMKMSHLVHLSIDAANENEVLPMEALCLPVSIYKLDLNGQLEKKRMPQILSSWSHLNNLTILCLISSKLDEDSFASLVVLRDLCCLSLIKAYDGKKLCFSVQSFPKLQELNILCAPQLNQVIIQEGALESLVRLTFDGCPDLKHLPHGIEYLAALEALRLEDTAEELIEKLRQESKANECTEELMKISHVRRVFVCLTEKNIWERIL